MLLVQGQKIADIVIGKLKPYCGRIEVAGSIRRKKPIVRDIDIVLIPSDLWNLTHEIAGLGMPRVSGDAIKSIILSNSAQVDFYFATRETWATLFLIRTGSTENNIRLYAHAKKMGWHLAANGDGLFNAAGNRVAGDTEESIYTTLGLRYQRPEERW